MARILTAALLAALPFAAGAALAQTSPAAPAATTAPAADPAAETTMKLSEILTRIEAEPGFLRFDDIEWDNRGSRWDIDYLGTLGRKISVAVDGKTGDPVIE